MTLQEMFDYHNSLEIPIKAEDELLDELLFMVIDLDTVVMGYAEAILKDISPQFELDADRAEKNQLELRRLQGLNKSDQDIQKTIDRLLTSLIGIRDHLKENYLN